MSRARELADLGGSADAGGITGRNLIINGAMNVNQYGSSSTASGRQTVDRFYNIMSTDATITQSKTAITSGSPYDEGFRNVYKHTVTTASASPTSGHYLGIEYRFEAQDVSGSGWNYTSTSSSVTLSFWAKSSVAGTYTVSLRSPNSVHKDQSFEYTLTANTWKKVTHTFTGDSGISILNDNTIGLNLYIWLHLGADFTGSSHTYNTWVNYDGYSQAGDYAQNWMQTASATFEVTGVQLEVGEATPFEHRSYGDELARCQRFYQSIDTNGRTQTIGFGHRQATNTVRFSIPTPVALRADPSISISGTVNCLESDGSATATTSISGLYNSSGYVVATGTVSGVVAGSITMQGYGGTVQIDAEL